MASIEESNNRGASPLPKGKRKRSIPLFKSAEPKPKEHEKRDITGQTDTSLEHMKQRLAEVPKKSSGSTHDKAAFEKKK